MAWRFAHQRVRHLPSATRSAPHPPLALLADDVLVLRLGDPEFTALLATSTLPAFPAYPTYWDEITPSGDVIRSTPNHRDFSGGQRPCTLGVGVDEWTYDTDGLPSNSEDGFLAVAPCYTIPVGANMETALNNPKVISVFQQTGVSETALLLSYNESYASGGIRQAATVDGSTYWLSGMGSSDWGFRVFSSGGGATTSVAGDNPDDPGAWGMGVGTVSGRAPQQDARTFVLC